MVTTVVSVMIVPMILGPFEHKAVHSMDRGVVNFLSSLCRAETRASHRAQWFGSNCCDSLGLDLFINASSVSFPQTLLKHLLLCQVLGTESTG